MADPLKSQFGGSTTSALDAPASHPSKGHSILHNLLNDAIDTAKGIPFGMVQTVEHPVRVAKAVGKSYADEYGHGFGHFWQQFHAHPLQPLLDAISVPLILAGGAGLAIKGASGVAELGNAARLGADYTAAMERASALTRAGKFAEADAERASVMRYPGLDKMAQRFRKGTTATTRMVQTPVEGLSLPKAYSSNLFRRALTKGSDAIIEGMLGKKVNYFSTEHLGERMLAKELEGRRPAATAARMFGQARILKEAEKKGLAPAEVGQALVDNYRQVHMDNAMRIPLESAQKLAKNKYFKENMEFIYRDQGKTFLHDKAGNVINEGKPVEPWIAEEAVKFQPQTPDYLNTNYRKMQAQFGQDVTGYISGGRPEHALYKDEQTVAQKGETVYGPATRPHKLESYDQAHAFIRMMGKSVQTGQKLKHALVEDGNVLVVRKGLGKQLQTDLEGSAKLANQIYRKPLTVWKWFILGMSPRYFVNNVVGNAGMFAAATNPVEFTRGVLSAIRSARGIRNEARAQAAMGNEVEALIARYLPNEWIAQNMSYLQHSAIGTDRSIWMGQANPIEKARYGAFHSVTEKAAYRGPQRASLMGALVTDSDFRNLYRSYRAQGIEDTVAFQKAAKVVTDNPAKRAAFEKRVTDWAGQYYHMNSLERALTAVVPFYNWDRHALRFGKEQVLSRPVRSATLSQLGALGDKQAQRELGNVPDFLKGAIPVQGHAGGLLGLLFGQNINGRRKVMLTSGLNPLAAAAEDVHSIAALAGGGHPTEALASQLNPVVSGAISGTTGQKIFSGAKETGLNVGGKHIAGGPLGGILDETFAQLPQARLLQAEFGTPQTKTKKGDPTLYTHSVRQQLSSIFGLNERDFSPKAAQRLYDQEHHIKKGRRRARKDAQAMASAIKSNL